MIASFYFPVKTASNSERVFFDLQHIRHVFHTAFLGTQANIIAQGAIWVNRLNYSAQFLVGKRWQVFGVAQMVALILQSRCKPTLFPKSKIRLIAGYKLNQQFI